MLSKPTTKRVRIEGNHLIISPEARQELQEGKTFKVLAEVYRAARYAGWQEANAGWIKELNRTGGIVRWAKTRFERKTKAKGGLVATTKPRRRKRR